MIDVTEVVNEMSDEDLADAFGQRFLSVTEAGEQYGKRVIPVIRKDEDERLHKFEVSGYTFSSVKELQNFQPKRRTLTLADKIERARAELAELEAFSTQNQLALEPAE